MLSKLSIVVEFLKFLKTRANERKSAFIRISPWLEAVGENQNLFKQQTKSPNILSQILGLSRRNYDNKLSDYSIFL